MQELFQERVVAVLVPYPVERAYSYAVPPGMALAPGDYVTVPLGPRQVAGVVWDGDADTGGKKLKTVLARHDLPPLPEVARRFIEWVAQYNMAPLGFVLKMSLSVPGGLEKAAPVMGYTLNDAALKAFSPSGRGLGEGDRKVDAQHRQKPIEKFFETAKDPSWLQLRAKELRQNHTDAEKKLWYNLNKQQLAGLKFRRQHPVHPYIVDFACLEKKLIVEIDGGQHDEQKDSDAQRTATLQQEGYRVIRFWNNEVLENIEGVLGRIAENAFKSPSPNPLPSGERALSVSPARRKVLEVLKDNRPRRVAAIAELAGCTTAVVTGMAKLGLLRAVEMPAPAPCSAPDVERAGVKLSAAQTGAATTMREFVEAGEFQAALLDGVTGAGKTEVYFEAVAQALRAGKQALILLPEIALSNAFLDRFRARFGCTPALWHSGLTPAQRKIAWRGVATGETRVVVGARSALFLPYAELGVIIVDEEHDPAYKQEDGVIYHARDMAVVRAHLGKIPVVLVSATPSLETISNVWAGRYRHLHLPDRHGGARLPEVHVIDMKTDKPERQRFLSPSLIKAVRENLASGGQSLLFLNRRGYAPLTLCRTCGHRMNCPRCTAWLVEHKRHSSDKLGRLECHHCGYHIPVPATCPSCGDADSFAACGPGVERILEEVTELFPAARTLVLASDTATTQDELRTVLNDIRDHQYDIIIGTQIIAKGHHFPKLTLVGVVDADLGLQGGDLRAAERTFQLLHQVAGRAGRESSPGHVYLQTYLPQNKVMQALTHHQRDDFLEAESQERDAAQMPPFTRLAGVIVQGKDETQVREAALALAKQAPHAQGLQTLGPAEAPFYRLRGNYRRRLLVRADKELNVQKVIEGWLAQVKLPSAVRVIVDIDPQSFL